MTQRILLETALILALAAVATGCAGHSGDDDAAAKATDPPLPADCQGHYECVEVSGLETKVVGTGALLLVAGHCYYQPLGSDSLVDLADDAITIEGRSFSTRGELDGSIVTIECVPGEPPTSSQPQCTGISSSCNAVATCDLQDGCTYDIHAADDPYDDSCDGSSTPCDYFETQTACESQDGCKWG
ncbi:MAG TPA: hypothetical protein VMI54_20635 [Polyangiaceae bacterium]|nr:hypothetical protein [Polyangiaceae bacterium]